MSLPEEGSSSADASMESLKEQWTCEQNRLASLVRIPSTAIDYSVRDNLAEGFMLPATLWNYVPSVGDDLRAVMDAAAAAGNGAAEDGSCPSSSSLPPLEIIGGIDISFVPHSDQAVASIAILSYPELEVLHVMMHECVMEHPYIPGFLAFREVVPVMALMEKLRSTEGVPIPQLLFVDGCGVHHPRRCGLATHLGVLLDIPTIGCAKNFLAVDGLQREDMEALFTNVDSGKTAAHDVEKQAVEQSLRKGGTRVNRHHHHNHRNNSTIAVRPIIGHSGTCWGHAVKNVESLKRLLFISPGHRIGFQVAVAFVLSVCVTHVAEPVRQADLQSREYIRQRCTTPSEKPS